VPRLLTLAGILPGRSHRPPGPARTWTVPSVCGAAGRTSRPCVRGHDPRTGR